MHIKKERNLKKKKWFHDGYIDNKVIVDRSGVYKVGKMDNNKIIMAMVDKKCL